MSRQTPATKTNAPLGLSEQLEQMLKANENVVAKELDTVFNDTPIHEEPSIFPEQESDAFQFDKEDGTEVDAEADAIVDRMLQSAEAKQFNQQDIVEGVDKLFTKEKKKRARAPKKEPHTTIDAVRADVNNILMLNEHNKATHWRLSELGLNLPQISSITGAGVTNVGRDLWAFRAGKCALPDAENYKRKPAKQ